MGNILNVNNINVYYGAIHAIKGISFKVEEGEIVTLIGANGAGKSTTLNTISGLLRSKTGDISFMGSSISKMSPNKIVQSGLVMVPEGRRIFLGLTVEENLEMGAYTRPKAEIKSSLEEVYELFPRLKERRTQIGGTLSGGEQQMLAMGRSLMAKPKLMMLDEPSMGLAPLLVAPMKCATCTEKPMFAADARPPISQPVVSTSPMAAEALAPRWPTIEASIKNMTVAEICARIEGILRLTMSQSFSLWVIVRPSRMYDRSSSLFFIGI